MKSTKLNLAVGIAIGAILTFFYLNYFAPRYEVEKVGLSFVKVDKWTGQSWRYLNSNWEKVGNTNQEWKEIDQTLAEALNIPIGDSNTLSALNLLREKYPILKDIPNDELQERIKLVYSKQILWNLYLDNFLKLQKSAAKEQETGFSTGE